MTANRIGTNSSCSRSTLSQSPSIVSTIHGFLSIALCLSPPPGVYKFLFVQATPRTQLERWYRAWIFYVRGERGSLPPFPARAFGKKRMMLVFIINPYYVHIFVYGGMLNEI